MRTVNVPGSDCDPKLDPLHLFECAHDFQGVSGFGPRRSPGRGVDKRSSPVPLFLLLYRPRMVAEERGLEQWQK